MTKPKKLDKTKTANRTVVQLPPTAGDRQLQLKTSWNRYKKRYGKHLTAKQAHELRQKYGAARRLLTQAIKGEAGWTGRAQAFLKGA